MHNTWACERFSQYVIGRKFQVESDHKPLIPLLSSKKLDCLPPRIIRFRLRMARFDYAIEHVPGKFLYTADTLSRAPIASKDGSEDLQREVEAFVNTVLNTLPTTEKRLEKYCKAQAEDETCAQVKEYCRKGWPKQVPGNLQIAQFWHVRSSLSVENELLLFGSRIVILSKLHHEVLQRIHEGHQGLTKCRMRAQSSVWWPGISRDIAQMIHCCPTCIKVNRQPREPLITTKLPDYPWQVVGSDFGEEGRKHWPR